MFLKIDFNQFFDNIFFENILQIKLQLIEYYYGKKNKKTRFIDLKNLGEVILIQQIFSHLYIPLRGWPQK